MNRKPFLKYGNENGAALITTVLILVAVTVIGLLASRSSLIEQRIGTNDKIHKRTWYATEAVVSGLMPELIEQNIEKRGFGAGAPPIAYGPSNQLNVYTSDFYNNEQCAIPSETNRDVQANNLAQTNVYVSIYGRTELSAGNAIQLPEGYTLPRGGGAAGGGTQKLYIIRGLGVGAANSQAYIPIGYRHVI